MTNKRWQWPLSACHRVNPLKATVLAQMGMLSQPSSAASSPREHLHPCATILQGMPQKHLGKLSRKRSRHWWRWGNNWGEGKNPTIPGTLSTRVRKEARSKPAPGEGTGRCDDSNLHIQHPVLSACQFETVFYSVITDTPKECSVEMLTGILCAS